MLTTTEMRYLRKAAGKTRMDKIRNKEIRRRVNMQPAEQTAIKNKIRWWSHIKRMTPAAPQSKTLVIHPVGRRLRRRPRNRWEDNLPIIIMMAGMAVFYVAGYLIEERHRWPVITASPRGRCSK